MIFNTEKVFEEFGQKVDEASRRTIKDAISVAKKTLEGDDIEALKNAFTDLQNSSHRLAEAMYADVYSEAAKADGGKPDGDKGKRQ